MENENENFIALSRDTPSGYKTLFLKALADNDIVFVIYKDAFYIKPVIEELRSFKNYKLLYGIPDRFTAYIRQSNEIIFVEQKDFRHVFADFLNKKVIQVKAGAILSQEEIVNLLVRESYARVNYVEQEGEFAKRGSIIDIFCRGDYLPIRIEFSYDTVISLRYFAPDTQRSEAELSCMYMPLEKGHRIKRSRIKVVKLVDDSNEFVMPVIPVKGNFAMLQEEMTRFIINGYRVIYYSGDRDRARKYSNFINAEVKVGLIHEGFIDNKNKLAVFTELSVFPLYKRRRKSPRERTEELRTFLQGDYVVHLDYGIGKFLGMRRIKAFNKAYDCLKIQYRDGILDIPTYNMYKIERFNVEEKESVKLSSITGSSWKKRRLRAEIRVIQFARDILKIHAKRKRLNGFVYDKNGEMSAKVALDFPYLETEDQEQAIKDVEKDMESSKCTDRLIAGDVGFGKTEVALRAAIKAIENGRQVIILVPTTVLALQHYKNFKNRLSKYPVHVAMLSRLTPTFEKKSIKNKIKSGVVDLVVATHYILRSEVDFKNLGLLIIDEEHRFGVRDKETIRKKFPLVDTIRLSATPIPRTLNMSLGRIYDISIIKTPPAGREEVATYVGTIEDKIIKKAVEFELNRKGKVFYIYNRISDMDRIKRRIERIVPYAKVLMAHGKMRTRQLEDVLIEFYEGDVDILLSTAIMESGIDFPIANTIIVENANLFGLADLHQLRGRVGRGMVKGYAYFLVPPKISYGVKERLKALLKYHHLGSGFKIALKDMEIRGAGNIVGVEQHGFINSIGPSLFFKLLDMAITEENGMKKSECELIFKCPAYIPEDFIKEDEVRIGFYSKISDARAEDELFEIIAELKDRFGTIPEPLSNFLYGVNMKIIASFANYNRVILSRDNVCFEKSEHTNCFKRLDVNVMKEFLKKAN